jgi:hypothetical protein
MQNDQLFFPHQEGDDLEEIYEELLFQDKQFFTTKAIVPKVFRARLEKMKTREGAYRRLSGTKASGELDFSSLLYERSNDLLQNYLNFQKFRAEVMQYLYRANELLQVVDLMEKLIKVYMEYLAKWQLNDIIESKEILISKEPDPTDLFNSLKSFSDAGGKNVNEIQTLFFNGKSLLETEAKRLSLLLQFEK